MKKLTKSAMLSTIFFLSVNLSIQSHASTLGNKFLK